MNQYRTSRHLLIDTRYDGEQVLVYRGFIYDGDTYAIDWREWEPELRAICPMPAPAAHDLLWGYKFFASGKPCTWAQSNRIYFDLCHSSTNPFRRLCSHVRDTLLGTRMSERRWDALPHEPIPAEFAHLYGNTQAAVDARTRECWRVVTGPGNRLIILPPARTGRT